MKKKEVVRIRTKLLNDGNQSIYFDIYLNGVRKKEFPKLYLIPERSKEDKELNAKTLEIAEAMKSQRIIELYENGAGLKKKEQIEVKLIEYVESVIERKSKSGKSGMVTNLSIIITHLKQYKKANIKLNEVDSKFLREFIEYLQYDCKSRKGGHLKKQTIHNYYAWLEACIHQAIKDDLIEKDPTRNVEKPRTEDAMREYLTLEELKLLLNAVCPKLTIRQSFLFACFTGLRISDIRSLKWSNIIESDNGLQIRYKQKKTQKENYIPLSDSAIQTLPQRKNAKDSDNVFKLPCNITCNTMRE